VSAQPPLALNLNLVSSARWHSADMAYNGYFGHQRPASTSAPPGALWTASGSEWPNWMARQGGYTLPTSWPDTNNYIKSIAAYGTSGSSVSYSPQDALKALIIDANTPSLGHRIHLLAMNSFNQSFREVGTGYATGGGWTSGVNAAAYWAIHTGRHDSDPVWLTGVVYIDSNSNGRYDQGEGLQGVTVAVSGATNKNTTTTVGGGWSIDVSSGTWDLTCSGGTFTGTATANVTLTTANIEVDFISGNSAGEVNFGNQVVNPPGGGGGSGGSDSGGGGGCAVERNAGLDWLAVLAVFFASLLIWRRRVSA